MAGPILEALNTIRTVYAELVSNGKMRPLPDYYPADARPGYRRERERREYLMPAYWDTFRPVTGNALGLDVAGTPEEQEGYRRERRQAWERDWQYWVKLYEEAEDAWELIGPIERACEQLHYSLSVLAMQGAGPSDIRVIQKLMLFRNHLTLYADGWGGVQPNVACRALIGEMDKGLDRIRDTMARSILCDLFSGKVPEGQANGMIAMLEEAAANGQLPNIEEHVAWAEAQAS